MAAMKIELTRDLKVTLLEAVKNGTLDLSIFDKAREEQAQSIEETQHDIVRLAMLDPKASLLALSDLMRQYANGEITASEYTNQRSNMIKSK